MTSHENKEYPEKAPHYLQSRFFSKCMGRQRINELSPCTSFSRDLPVFRNIPKISVHHVSSRDAILVPYLSSNMAPAPEAKNFGHVVANEEYAR